MKLLSPTQHKRLNEVIGFLLLSLGLVILLSLVSYHTQDPSWDTASESQPLNLVGYPGSYSADLLFQAFGATAFLFPLLLFLLAWKWIRSDGVEAGWVKMIGAAILTLGSSAGLAFLPCRMFGGAIRVGGTAGYLLARYLLGSPESGRRHRGHSHFGDRGRVSGIVVHAGHGRRMVGRSASVVRPAARRLAGLARPRTRPRN